MAGLVVGLAMAFRSSASRLRFKDNPQARARRLREALEGVSRWANLPSLDPSDVVSTRPAITSLGVLRQDAVWHADAHHRSIDLS
jgi:hypothetical protein